MKIVAWMGMGPGGANPVPHDCCSIINIEPFRRKEMLFIKS